MKEREKWKGGKDEEVNGQGGREVPRPHTGHKHHKLVLGLQLHRDMYENSFTLEKLTVEQRILT